MGRGNGLAHGVFALLAVCFLSLGSPVLAQIRLEPLGRYLAADNSDANVFDTCSQEIVAHDPLTQRLFVTNDFQKRVDVLDIGTDPAQPMLVTAIDVSGFGANLTKPTSPTSVDVFGSMLAVSIRETDPETSPGIAAFFDTSSGALLGKVTVGAFPDKIHFSPDGLKALVANEGQPLGDYSVDPEGSVSIIDISGGAAGLSQDDVVTADFSALNGLEDDLNAAGIRIFGPGASVAQDLEPEYLTISADSSTAWVTLQENNAIATLDIASGQFTSLLPLGSKNHRSRKNPLDASDRDGGINIRTWPLKGIYQPDGIAAYVVDGVTYLVTGNEGDARDYDAFSEVARVADLTLGKGLLGRFPDLQAEANLGRLNVTTQPPSGKEVREDGTEVFSELYAFGARSFTIWTADGELVFDSGDEFEAITAVETPAIFNSNNTETRADRRSDDKGPEPEDVALGEIGGRTYAFIGLERIGGVIVYDITGAGRSFFVDYVNTRLPRDNPLAATELDDLGPEGVLFISAANSPTGLPLIVLANEVSGTTVLFEVVSD